MLNIRMHQLIIFQLSLLIFGCAGQLSIAKKAISIADQAFIEIDYQFSVEYEKARVDARESSSSWLERDKKLDSWEKARAALIATGYGLQSASMAVSIAEEGEYYSDWKTAIGKAYIALDALCNMLDKLGMKLPKETLTKIVTGKTLLRK